ncbi:hypothetical protein [Kribbella sp. NPDC050459]|uniref:hypothetical protein n=1 Tax=Kribbella sp. NPDC050459 TaxID=3155785 RepID=UPI0033E5596E
MLGAVHHSHLELLVAAVPDHFRDRRDSTVVATVEQQVEEAVPLRAAQLLLPGRQVVDLDVSPDSASAGNTRYVMVIPSTAED